MTIEVNPVVTPLFTQVSAICAGDALAPLPTISNNEVEGTWSPALNNLATTTYTFTSDASCTTVVTMTIEVINLETPSGEAQQTFLEGATLSSIVVTPENVVWYATFDDAISGNNPLDLNQILENEAIYYAVNENGFCSSEPFAVTVSITLNVNLIDLKDLKFYPNPVVTKLQISYNKPITSVEVYSLLGQLLMKQDFNSTTVEMSLESLPSSVYMVKIMSDQQLGSFKIMKR
jgi:hypothetical protein